MIDRAELWLLRHGVAADKAMERTDLEDYARALTKKGVRQSIDAGRLVAKVDKIHKVYTSPRVRCVQSAVLAAEQLGCPFKRDKRLDHGQKHDPLEHVKNGRAVLLVVHKDVAGQVKQLTGRTVDMSRGSLARIRIVNGQATLDKLLTPTDIRTLVRGAGAKTLDWHFNPDQPRGWHGRWSGASEVSHHEFARALRVALAGPYGNSLASYTPQEMAAAGMVTYLAHGGKVGGALKPNRDGVHTDAVSPFNLGGPRGAGLRMLKHLEALGANQLDCFAWLEPVYTRAGWHVVDRVKWDDKYAPAGWDYERFGRPDILVMRPD